MVNITALASGDTGGALKFFGEAPAETVIYRGWILHPQEYATLHEALTARGCQVLTSPSAYRQGLLFPEYFPAISDCSFPAVWIAGYDARRALKVARQLGPPPYFIKDYAKSAKEIWPKGCVVDRDRAMAPTIRALREFRGGQFAGGIVIRPLLRLR